MFIIHICIFLIYWKMKCFGKRANLIKSVYRELTKDNVGGCFTCVCVCLSTNCVCVFVYMLCFLYHMLAPTVGPRTVICFNKPSSFERRRNPFVSNSMCAYRRLLPFKINMLCISSNNTHAHAKE